MHSVWRGAISFGLVNIPIRLYHASKEHELKFHLLHKKDLSEIRYARICKSDGKEVPWEDIVKGYEVSDGNYVVMTDEDFEKANPKKTRTLEILSFADEKEIEPLYYQMPYFLEPEKGAAKAYNLLREALQKSKKVAIANFVFRNHEHIGMIMAHAGILMLVQLRYHSELLSPKEINVPKEESVPKKELEVALKFVDQLTETFNPAEYSDTYTKEIKAIIAQKGKGKKIKVKKGEEPKSPKIHDIMSLLKESLEQSRPKKKKRRSA